MRWSVGTFFGVMPSNVAALITLLRSSTGPSRAGANGSIVTRGVCPSVESGGEPVEDLADVCDRSEMAFARPRLVLRAGDALGEGVRMTQRHHRVGRALEDLHRHLDGREIDAPRFGRRPVVVDDTARPLQKRLGV